MTTFINILWGVVYVCLVSAGFMAGIIAWLSFKHHVPEFHEHPQQWRGR